jgi:hypothetical protein
MFPFFIIFYATRDVVILNAPSPYPEEMHLENDVDGFETPNAVEHKNDDVRTQLEIVNKIVCPRRTNEVSPTFVDVNGMGIDRRILYHLLPHHLKYSPSSSLFPASGEFFLHPHSRGSPQFTRISINFKKIY